MRGTGKSLRESTTAGASLELCESSLLPLPLPVAAAAAVVVVDTFLKDTLARCLKMGMLSL